MSSTANRVIKNTGYLYAKMGITMFVSLYTTRLILNSLGASDFGIFNIVGGAIAMLGFLNSAMASATQRFMSYSEGEGDKEKQKCIFNISLIIHFFTALLVIVTLTIAGFFFFNGILNIPTDRIGAAEVVYGSLIVSTAFTVMTVPYDAVMNAHENMLYYAIVGIFESLLKLAVAFACVYTSADKLIVYGILMACIPLVTLTIMRVYCHRHYDECVVAPRRYYNKATMKEMLSFSGWNFMSSLSSLLTHQGNNIVLNFFFGTVINAAQGITYQLSGQLGALSTTVAKALNPVIVKEAGGKQLDAMYRSSSMGSKVTFFMTSTIFLPVMLNIDYVLRLWLVNVPEYTAIFVLFYFSINFIDNFGIFFNTAINGVGKIKQMSIYGCIINLLPFMGAIGLFSIGCPPYFMYILWVMASLMRLVVRFYYSYKLCHFEIKAMVVNDLMRPALCIIITACMCICVKWMLGGISSIVGVVVYMVAIVTAYILIFWNFGVNKSEQLLMKEIVWNGINKVLNKKKRI